MEPLNYILQRYSDNRQSTLGVMLKKITSGKETKTVLQGYTLEDEFRASKVSGETRIPANIYEIVIHQEVTPKTLQYQKKYPWFEKHLEIYNVKNFVGIYIHIGNDEKDTDGCVLLGDSVDNNTITQGTISNSTNCFRRFYKELYEHLKAGGKAFIDIRDEIRIM